MCICERETEHGLGKADGGDTPPCLEGGSGLRERWGLGWKEGKELITKCRAGGWCPARPLEMVENHLCAGPSLCTVCHMGSASRTSLHQVLPSASGQGAGPSLLKNGGGRGSSPLAGGSSQYFLKRFFSFCEFYAAPAPLFTIYSFELEFRLTEGNRKGGGDPGTVLRPISALHRYFRLLVTANWIESLVNFKGFCLFK